jgi:hypothetical protein
MAGGVESWTREVFPGILSGFRGTEDGRTRAGPVSTANGRRDSGPRLRRGVSSLDATTRATGQLWNLNPKRWPLEAWISLSIFPLVGHFGRSGIFSVKSACGDTLDPFTHLGSNERGISGNAKL